MWRVLRVVIILAQAANGMISERRKRAIEPRQIPHHVGVVVVGGGELAIRRSTLLLRCV